MPTYFGGSTCGSPVWHADPDPDRPVGEAGHRLRDGRDGRLGGRERDEERVAFTVDLVAAVARTGLADDAPVLLERVAVDRRPELLEQRRRPLDVREHHRHRSRGLGRRHDRAILGDDLAPVNRRSADAATMRGPGGLDLLVTRGRTRSGVERARVAVAPQRFTCLRECAAAEAGARGGPRLGFAAAAVGPGVGAERDQLGEVATASTLPVAAMRTRPWA